MLVTRLRRILAVLSFTALLLTESASRNSNATIIESGQGGLSGRYLGDPIQGATPDQLQDFEKGFSLFVKIWTVEDGIGPDLNARSCVTCHRVPTPGGSGTSRDTFVLRSPNAIDITGDTVFPRFHVNPDGSVQENKLPKHISARKTPPLFGLGLLEAVPTHVLLEYADPNDANGDGVSGRLVKVGKGFGRFGWKGNVGNIQDFVEGAFAVEIGLLSKTLALRVAQKKHLPKASDSAEVNSDQVQIVSQFIRFLGAPRLTGETGLSRGKELFESTGCAKCHRPSLTTGPGTAPFGNQKIFPYTDLLVHAMGPQLGDGIAANGISGQEFRTPPLWGIASTGPPYLHDGRANSVYEAVLAHGGEARNSARRYRRLTEADLAALLRFVNSL